MSGSHHHDHEQGDRDLEKLRVLLPHWIEHNEEHATSFQKWAAKARELGREETARHMGKAVERMAACNDALAAALEALKLLRCE